MLNHNALTKKWIILGIISGLMVSFIYPALMFIPLPEIVQTFLIMLFGPLLGFSSAGLYYFITLNKKSVFASSAVVSNIIAGVLITTMLLVQVAIRSAHPGEIDEASKWIWNSMNKVHMGLDVAWDVYIFFGTLFFAVSMFKHPKFGKIIASAGIIISILLIVLNAVSFPVPPANAGLVDVGPFVGLWYLAVTIMIIFNIKWVDERIKLLDR
ncbi:MAG: hypothetical protein WBG58_11975 [Ignavibacteriaceae bacterium]